VLGLRERDVCFSAAKLFFAYGLGNALSFPLSVGATTLLMAERPTPEATFKRWIGRGRAASSPPCSSAHRPAMPACWRTHAARPQRSRCAWPRRPARRCRPRSASASSAHFGVDIVDGIGSTEMLHIFLSNRPERVRYGTTGWPVPGYAIELRGDDGAEPSPTANPATCTSRARARR
jgi:benzoate-CoA ligase